MREMRVMTTTYQKDLLTGKTALVTGGSRGLGLQLAHALGEAGAKIMLSSRKASDLEEAAADLQAAGIDIASAIAQGMQLTLQGIDGYRTQMPLTQAVRWRILLATQLDGLPLSVGGVGPLWAIFAPQNIPELSQLPIKQRFPAAVWGLYYIQVSPATV